MENTQMWINLIVSALTGLSICIPLIVELIKYISASVKEKNWNELVKLTMTYMQTAESKFDKGAEKKEWVLSMIETSAESINYELDDAAIKKIGDLIDSICDASRIINPKTK